MAMKTEFGRVVYYKLLSPDFFLSSIRSVIRIMTWKESKDDDVPQFDLRGKLGAGGFGSVVLAQHPHSPREDKLVAVKRLRWYLDGKYHEVVYATLELDIMLAVQNNAKAKDFFLEAYWAFVSSARINIVMEPAPYGSLEILIDKKPRGRMEVDEARLYMADLAHALSLLHDMQITHGDIKPGNIVVCDRGLIKICDLGLAMYHAGDSAVPHYALHKRGTLLYMAPEMIYRNPKVADWYSVGCVFFEMVTGRKYFVADPNDCSCNFSRQTEKYCSHSNYFESLHEHANNCEVYDLIQHMDRDKRLEKLKEDHNDLYQVISGLTNPEPSERMCLLGVQELKSAPFFESICWDCVALRKCCGNCVSPALPWQEREVPDYERFETSSFDDFKKCQFDLNTVSDLLEITFNAKAD